MLDVLIESMNNLYKSFMQDYQGSQNWKFIEDTIFLKTVVTNMHFILSSTQLVYVNTLKKDTSNSYKRCQNIVIMLSVLSLGINFIFFVLSFIIILNKVNGYVNLFGTTGMEVYEIIIINDNSASLKYIVEY